MKCQPPPANVWIMGIALIAGNSVVAQDQGYGELRGTWQAVELVDNGQVIPAEAIPGWLPSGGRLEIVDNTIVFYSTKDGRRHARAFSLDATTYPRQLNLLDGQKCFGHGIYRMDEGRLVVCLASPNVAPRPTDFSAREGSRRALIVYTRQDERNHTPAVNAQTVSATSTANRPVLPSAPPLQAGFRPLTDTEIGTKLPGTWTTNDAFGAIFLTLDRNNTYSTYRESVESSTLQKVFTKLPISSGTWSLRNGQVVLQCTSATHADRLYKSFPFTIQSVTATELQFVDYAGNIAKAVRVQR